MMLRYVSKFFLEIFPSIVATVVGAYIVNHYINPRPASDAPVSAVHAKATPAADEVEGAVDVTPKPETQVVKASGDRISGDRPSAEKAGEPADSARIQSVKSEAVKAAAESRRIPAREKAIAREAKPVLSDPAPAVTASVPDNHRDAVELAREAIERLRNTPDPVDPAVRVQDAAREQTRDAGRGNVVVVPPPPARAAYVQPLSPRVVASYPSAQVGAGANWPVQQEPSSMASSGLQVRLPDAQRPIPPAEIPQSPLDLMVVRPAPKPTMADDVMAVARSVIHAVVPQ